MTQTAGGRPPLRERIAVAAGLLAFAPALVVYIAGQSLASDYTGRGTWKVERGRQFRLVIGVDAGQDIHLVSTAWLWAARIGLAVLVLSVVTVAVVIRRIRMRTVPPR